MGSIALPIVQYKDRKDAIMMIPRKYPMDLRERFIKFIQDGGTARGAAREFDISPGTAIRWAKKFRQTGNLVPGRDGRPAGSTLEPYADFLIATMESRPQIPMSEIRDRLAKERGVSVGVPTVARFFALRGIPPRGNAPKSAGGTE